MSTAQAGPLGARPAAPRDVTFPVVGQIQGREGSAGAGEAEEAQGPSSAQGGREPDTGAASGTSVPGESPGASPGAFPGDSAGFPETGREQPECEPPGLVFSTHEQLAPGYPGGGLGVFPIGFPESLPTGPQLLDDPSPYTGAPLSEPSGFTRTLSGGIAVPSFNPLSRSEEGPGSDALSSLAPFAEHSLVPGRRTPPGRLMSEGNLLGPRGTGSVFSEAPREDGVSPPSARSARSALSEPTPLRYPRDTDGLLPQLRGVMSLSTSIIGARGDQLRRQPELALPGASAEAGGIPAPLQSIRGFQGIGGLQPGLPLDEPGLETSSRSASSSKSASGPPSQVFSPPPAAVDGARLGLPSPFGGPAPGPIFTSVQMVARGAPGAELPQGVPQGMPGSIVGGIAGSISPGMAPGMPSGIPSGIPPAMAPGVPQGLVPSAPGAAGPVGAPGGQIPGLSVSGLPVAGVSFQSVPIAQGRRLFFQRVRPMGPAVGQPIPIGAGAGPYMVPALGAFTPIGGQKPPKPLEISDKETSDIISRNLALHKAAYLPEILPSFYANVIEYVHSPFANHIVQEMIGIAPELIVPIVLNAVCESEQTFLRAAKGKFSCWVLQTILGGYYTYHEPFERYVVRNVLELSVHPSSNFVVQKAIGCSAFRGFDQICQNLLVRFDTLCLDKAGSHVAEAIITREWADNTLDRFAVWLMIQPYFLDLAKDQHGCFVVEKLAELSKDKTKMDCLRILRWLITTQGQQGSRGSRAPHGHAPRTPRSGSSDHGTETGRQGGSGTPRNDAARVLNSVRLKCRLLYPSFDSLKGMTQQDFIASAVATGLVSMDGKVLL